MANPNTFNFDQTLSTFAAGYSNDTYVADIVAPIVLVDQRSGSYKKRLLKDIITQVEDAISPHGEANHVEFEVEPGTFLTVDRALVDYVPADQIRTNALLSEEKVTRFVMNALMLNREIRVADLILTSGNYASANTANGSNWNTSGGTPLSDIDTGIAAVSEGMGEGTKLVGVTSLEVWQDLRRHADLRGGGASGPVVTREEAAARLGLDEILVSRASKNTANPGQAVTKSRIWGSNTFAILRVPSGDPTDEQGLFAATFRYREMADGEGVMVRKWHAPEKGGAGAEAIQCTLSDDEVIVQNNAGYLLTSLDA